MQLSQLLHDIIFIKPEFDRVIRGITQDSRQLKPGDLFFAYPGNELDGRQFIQQALAAGAGAVLLEPIDKDNLEPYFIEHTIIIPIKNLVNYLGIIASRFYGTPSHDLTVIGITGTNGKTSCSQLIAQALQQAGKICGVMGTIGNGLVGHLESGNLTTPDAVELHRMLAEFRHQGASHVSMEISSHRLAQGRINGLAVDVAVFTNLTRDHLDYHGTMEDYAAAKRLLFDLPGLRYGVINADDNYGKQWLLQLHNKVPVFAYSLEKPSKELSAIPHCYTGQIHLHERGMTASVYSPWGNGVLNNSFLVGRFNLSNLLAILTSLCLLDIDFTTVLNLVANLKGVPGRMESFGGGDKPLVVVDYSHTPHSLEQALRILREHCQGKLWCIFGCGGNRDRGKRPLMGSIAERYADEVIITNDNPRHEDPMFIVSDILQGLNLPAAAVVELDRRRAIEHAITCAQPSDVILVAGKGHESYQIVGDEKLSFSDRVEVRILLNE